MEGFVSKAISLVYQSLKMNLLFIFLSLSGLLVLGVGPAWLTVKELNYYHDQDNFKMSWNLIFKQFKKNFLKGNVLFYTCSLAIGLLAYNIFLGVQVENIWMMTLVIFLLFMVIFLISYTFYVFEIASIYEASYKDIHKLAFAMLFLDYFKTLGLIVLIIAISIVSYIYKGLFVLLTFGLLITVPSLITKRLIYIIEEKTNESPQYI